MIVGNVLDEQQEQDIVFVLAGIHAAPKFVAGGPEGGVEVRGMVFYLRDLRWAQLCSITRRGIIRHPHGGPDGDLAIYTGIIPMQNGECRMSWGAKKLGAAQGAYAKREQGDLAHYFSKPRM